jgi:hypothetical protein
MRRTLADALWAVLSETAASGVGAGRKRLLIRSAEGDPVPFCGASVVIMQARRRVRRIDSAACSDSEK